MNIYSYLIDGEMVYICSMEDIPPETEGVSFIRRSDNTSPELLSEEIFSINESDRGGDYSIDFRL